MYHGILFVLLVSFCSVFQPLDAVRRKSARIAKQQEANLAPCKERLAALCIEVSQGNCFSQALELALANIFSLDEQVKDASMQVLEGLCNQRHGSRAIRKVAKEALCSANNHERLVGLVLLELLVRHGWALEFAKKAALVCVCDVSDRVALKANVVFYALLDKKIFHDDIRSKALVMIDVDNRPEICARGLMLLASLVLEGVAQVDAEEVLSTLVNNSDQAIKKACNFLEHALDQNFLRRVYVAKKMTPGGVAALLVEHGLLQEEQEASFEGCCICCKDNYSNCSFVVTDCNHIFCSKCFDKWQKLHNACPLCRAPIYDEPFFEEGVEKVE